MRVLLLASENNAAAYLRKGLVENGFAVDVARANTDWANHANYDLLVCDGMARPAGVQVLKGVNRPPVLFLASPEGIEDTASGNSLTKPFGFSDFLTRVRSILHGGTGGVQESLEIADLRIDLVRQRASRNAVRLDLTPKEFLLLSLLMRRAGEILSRALIADQVWDINFDSNTNFVDVHIRRLRAKVDDPFARKLIHTVRGKGYVLEDRDAATPSLSLPRA